MNLVGDTVALLNLKHKVLFYRELSALISTTI